VEVYRVLVGRGDVHIGWLRRHKKGWVARDLGSGEKAAEADAATVRKFRDKVDAVEWLTKRPVEAV
jgi:hypothetical protein